MTTSPMLVEYLAHRAITVREEWERMCAEVLPQDGCVIEYGLACGGGAARWILRGATRVIGVDVDRELEWFWRQLSRAAEARGAQFDYLVTPPDVDAQVKALRNLVDPNSVDVINVDHDHLKIRDVISGLEEFLKPGGAFVVHDIIRDDVSSEVEGLQLRWRIKRIKVYCGLGYAILRGR